MQAEQRQQPSTTVTTITTAHIFPQWQTSFSLNESESRLVPTRSTISHAISNRPQHSKQHQYLCHRQTRRSRNKFREH
jgi:hypothetical protein